MDNLERDLASGALNGCTPPCLSLYQPTHRHHPENQQDPIRFRTMVKRLEASLRETSAAEAVDTLLAPFLALAGDHDFWSRAQDGVAVFGAPGVFRVYRLPRTVPELAMVADTFVTKPLIGFRQSTDRFQVLALTRQRVRLYEGTRDALDEIPLAPQIPRTLIEALGAELTEPHQTVASYGGLGAGHPAMHHGHGGKESEHDIDAERFFRVVARGVLDYHSKPTALPLILATLPDHQARFRHVSHNPFLVDEGIDTQPETLSLDDMRARAWAVIEPQYLARLRARVDEFGSARAHGLGTDDLSQVASAVVAGKVATLLVESDREIPGHVEGMFGNLTLADAAVPDAGDVLDDIASLTAMRGGEVVVVPSEMMPTETGVAAIYRY
ncbi:MAG: hypothetical protein IPP90_13490 [Gemmatimonadaceae bacterium]|nr:hypothetical protein [Gemmatimonadaceae bacterium]